MIKRFRAWLHRDCATVDAVEALRGNAGALQALAGMVSMWTARMLERPERVTVIVFVQRAAPAPLEGDETSRNGVTATLQREWIVVDSKTVRVGSKSERIDCTSYFPIASFQVLVLANLDRVDILGVFKGRDLLAMASPVAYGEDWHLGVNVSVLCSLREAGA